MNVPVPAWMGETNRRIRKKLVGSRLPPVLGHADWEAQNMRWLDNEPLAVLDWDSLAWLSEAVLVGTACGVFASHGSPILAPIESSLAFLDTYEAARGNAFSADERELVWAASVVVALHNARDELVFDRPRLSYDRLEVQHTERLALAGA
jgi:aminoglycoside phosphotransferase (APT) family kinase protein